MRLRFPEYFAFGTSTSAYQIETAFQHDWQGIISTDGNTFEQTTDHEKRIDEDVNIIASLAPHYRLSLMWSKLQHEPYGLLDEQCKQEYHYLLKSLLHRNVSIMMVIHHFANPVWFANMGGWSNQKNIDVWLDFAKKLVDEFGHYVEYWNTFNEPNLYATLGFALGNFPPFKKNILTASRVIKNMASAHDRAYDYIKLKFPSTQVGISHNCAVFHAQNFLGTLPAKLADRWYMEYLPSHFCKSDFWGISYYARISFDPLPITNLYTSDKIKKYNKAHDDIWEYYPEGLDECLTRYWQKFKKPIIITENGICTQDDAQRIASIKDYLKIIHKAMDNGIGIRGYYHWSTWDNFEWNLGPTYQFGLYACDLKTKARSKKPSAEVYASLAYLKHIDID